MYLAARPPELHYAFGLSREFHARRPDSVEQHLPERGVAGLHALDRDAAEAFEGLVLVERLAEGGDELGAGVRGAAGTTGVAGRNRPRPSRSALFMPSCLRFQTGSTKDTREAQR